MIRKSNVSWRMLLPSLHLVVVRRRWVGTSTRWQEVRVSSIKTNPGLKINLNRRGQGKKVTGQNGRNFVLDSCIDSVSSCDGSDGTDPSRS